MRAHPRVGGENRTALAQLDAAGGSSPRGRGKRDRLWSDVCGMRLIPAWAGKTRKQKKLCDPERAHPRVGGENLKFLVSATTDTGSSPRGRGKRPSIRGRA